MRTVAKAPFGTFTPPQGNIAPTEFRTEAFRDLILTHGYRLAWTRAAICPCTPVNDQNLGIRSDCPLCRGTGILYYGPKRTQALETETLNDTQRAYMKETQAFLIRGVMTNLQKHDELYIKEGRWRSGSCNCTVEPENKLSYRDRLVAIDSSLVYNEVVTLSSDVAQPLPLRYRATGPVHLCRSVDRQFEPDVDFYVRAGRLYFNASTRPPGGTRLAISYTTFPTWLVDDMPHSIRLANLQAQPGGVDLPLAVLLRLEFMDTVDGR